ncbi:MAG: ribosome biogenesis GTPase Der [Gammaproteobacteria bacterium]
MLPVIAIVGRPNVGKSTLFNRLTRSRAALVADLPGVTRDRLYGQGQFENRRFVVIDTGGLTENKHDTIEQLVAQQAWQAVAEADAVLFMVDARAGVTTADTKIAEHLRRAAKTIYVVANKADGLETTMAASEFYQFGFEQVYAISASHGTGVPTVMEHLLKKLPLPELVEETAPGIKMAIVGRPNVGKSTLVNRILGEERMLVYDQPGTTRDSVAIPFERQGVVYTLIDTAGVRRRARIAEGVEQFSVVKTLQAIAAANVVLMVINAQENITDQDLHLLGFIIEEGKGLVIAVNKWDGLTTYNRERVRQELSRRLSFADFARIYFISALHGTGVGNLFKAVKEAYRAATKNVPTSELTRILQDAVATHQPPAAQGRPIKLRYAHLGGHNPPLIVIHGKQTAALPGSYVRYLANYFRKRLRWVGTPIRIVLKSDKNPYKKSE